MTTPPAPPAGDALPPLPLLTNVRHCPAVRDVFDSLGRTMPYLTVTGAGVVVLRPEVRPVCA